ncbi:hypothetical protein ACVWYH_006715 [Bradyrhizobium sp. GM24.11]|jgi:hypothetical protein
MKNYQEFLEKLRRDAAEAGLIRDLATDKAKRAMFDRLHQHLNRLADDVEKAMKSGKPSAYNEKITFGEMRETGTREVLVYCRDRDCSHRITLNADCWPDEVRLSDLEPNFTCAACGKRGAEVRPKFSEDGVVRRCWLASE